MSALLTPESDIGFRSGAHLFETTTSLTSASCINSKIRRTTAGEQVSIEEVLLQTVSTSPAILNLQASSGVSPGKDNLYCLRAGDIDDLAGGDRLGLFWHLSVMDTLSSLFSRLRTIWCTMSSTFFMISGSAARRLEVGLDCLLLCTDVLLVVPSPGEGITNCGGATPFSVGDFGEGKASE